METNLDTPGGPCAEPEAAMLAARRETLTAEEARERDLYRAQNVLEFEAELLANKVRQLISSPCPQCVGFDSLKWRLHCYDTARSVRDAARPALRVVPS